MIIWDGHNRVGPWIKFWSVDPIFLEQTEPGDDIDEDLVTIRIEEPEVSSKDLGKILMVINTVLLTLSVTSTEPTPFQSEWVTGNVDKTVFF